MTILSNTAKHCSTGNDSISSVSALCGTFEVLATLTVKILLQCGQNRLSRFQPTVMRLPHYTGSYEPFRQQLSEHGNPLSFPVPPYPCSVYSILHAPQVEVHHTGFYILTNGVFSTRLDECRHKEKLKHRCYTWSNCSGDSAVILCSTTAIALRMQEGMYWTGGPCVQNAVHKKY